MLTTDRLDSTTATEADGWEENRQQTVVLCNGEEKTAEREKRKTSLVLWQAGCGLHDDRQSNRALDSGFLAFYQIDLAQLSRSFFQRSWKIVRLPAITREHNNIAAIIPTPSVVRHVLVYANSSRTLFPTASVSQYQQCDCRANNESSLSVCRSFCVRPSRALEVIRVRLNQSDGFEDAQRGAFYRGRAEQVKRREADRRFRRHLQADASD